MSNLDEEIITNVLGDRRWVGQKLGGSGDRELGSIHAQLTLLEAADHSERFAEP
jgi:hypothetical protein